MNTRNEELLEEIKRKKDNYIRRLQQANANHDELANAIQRSVDITKSDEDSEELLKLTAEIDMINENITDLNKAISALDERLIILAELDISKDNADTIINDIKKRSNAEFDLLDIKRFVIRQVEFYKLKYISAIKKKAKLEKRLSNADKASYATKEIQDNLNEATEDVKTATLDLEFAKRDITRYEELLAEYNANEFITESAETLHFWESIGLQNELFSKIKREEMAEEPEEEFRFHPETKELWPLSKFITEYGNKEGVEFWDMLEDEGSSSSFEQLPGSQPGSSQMHAAEHLSTSASQPQQKLIKHMRGSNPRSKTIMRQPRSQPGSSHMHAAEQLSTSGSQLPGSKPRRGFTKKNKGSMNTGQMPTQRQERSPTASLQQIPEEEEHRYIKDFDQWMTKAEFEANYEDNWRKYWDSAERVQQAPPPQSGVGQSLTDAQIRRQAIVQQTLSKRKEKRQGGRKQRHIAKTKKTMRLEYLLNLSNKLLKHKFKKQRNIKNIRKTKKYKNNKK